MFVAFAGTGGTPVNRRAGKATKLPPPATALIAPPRAPAKNRKMALCRFKQKFYHESGSSSKEGSASCSGESGVHLGGGLPPDRSKFALSHFLTTNADPYMNGAFQSPSATEDLARIPDRELTGGIQEEGVTNEVGVCPVVSLP